MKDSSKSGATVLTLGKIIPSYFPGLCFSVGLEIFKTQRKTSANVKALSIRLFLEFSNVRGDFKEISLLKVPSPL